METENDFPDVESRTSFLGKMQYKTDIMKGSKQRVLAIPYYKDCVLFYPLPLDGEDQKSTKLNRIYHNNRVAKWLLRSHFEKEDAGIKFLKRLKAVEELEIIYPSNFSEEKIQSLLVETVQKAMRKSQENVTTGAIILPLCVLEMFWGWFFVLDFGIDTHVGRKSLKKGKRVKKMMNETRISFVPNQELQDYQEKAQENPFEMPEAEQIEEICSHFGFPKVAKTVKKVMNNTHKISGRNYQQQPEDHQ